MNRKVINAKLTNWDLFFKFVVAQRINFKHALMYNELTKGHHLFSYPNPIKVESYG